LVAGVWHRNGSFRSILQLLVPVFGSVIVIVF
jgi:hypothetical protein